MSVAIFLWLLLCLKGLIRYDPVNVGKGTKIIKVGFAEFTAVAKEIFLLGVCQHFPTHLGFLHRLIGNSAVEGDAAGGKKREDRR